MTSLEVNERDWATLGIVLHQLWHVDAPLLSLVRKTKTRQIELDLSVPRDGLELMQPIIVVLDTLDVLLMVVVVQVSCIVVNSLLDELYHRKLNEQRLKLSKRLLHDFKVPHGHIELLVTLA